MPQTMSVKEIMHQPIWDGWRMKRNDESYAYVLIPDMNLFTAPLANSAISNNVNGGGHLVSDRSALVRRIGVFASFDSMDAYEEFWDKGSLEFIVNARVLHDFNAKDIEVPEAHGRMESGIPRPTHNYGYLGWYTLPLAAEIAPRSEFFVRLHSSKKLAADMLDLWNAPRDDFAAINVFLDTLITREVI